MKLEVLINETDPKIFSLDKSKVIIGSNENNHIIINEPSVSRKHAIIFMKEDRFYISDQGSINGTFINDEQLTPGKRVEMTIYSPVRLGANVLLTLITEDEASELEEVLPLNEFEVQENEEKTQVISLAELKKKHTEELQRKRASALPNRKKKAKKKKKNFPLLTTLILASVIAFVYKNQNEKRIPKEKKTVIQSFQPVSVERVPMDSVLALDVLEETFKKSKCSSDLEKSICSLLPSLNHKNFGPVVLDKDIIIFADSDLVIPQAREYLSDKTNEREIHLMALILWIHKNVTEKLKEIKDINDFRVTIALMNVSQKKPHLLLNGTFVPQALLQFKDRLKPEHFEKAKKNGFSEFYYYLDYGRYTENK